MSKGRAGKKCTEVKGVEGSFLTARARRHAFTWWRYSADDVERIKSFKEDTISYIVVGYEIAPTTNNKHLQGYVEWPKAVSGRQMLKTLLGRDNLDFSNEDEGCPIRGALCEKCRDANISYCKKTETKDPEVNEPFTEIIFSERKQGARNDIFHEVANKLQETPDFGEILSEFPEIAIKHHAGIDRSIRYQKEANTKALAAERFSNWVPWKWQKRLINELSVPCTDERKVIWYCDPKGNKGKSKLCDWLHFMLDAELLENGKTADLANAWKGKPIVLFDLSRSTQEVTNYGAIESIKNGRMFSPKYNSETKWAPQITHVVIFANWMPDTSKLSADRWDIRTIAEDDCKPWDCDLAIHTGVVDEVIDRVCEPVIVGIIGARQEDNYEYDNIADLDEIEALMRII